MHINIPGYEALDLSYLVCDYNGTLACDGKLSAVVRQQLNRLSEQLQIIVATADTHGTAKLELADLPVKLHTFPRGAAAPEKEKILQKLGPKNCAALGNGRNDIPMLAAAQLSISILGSEGAHGPLLLASDLVVHSPTEALDLFLKPERLRAGLRG